ncbi:P-loop containing nucleoside triphosphate hydrolase protein [Chytridium lagenaria]|nr:P-loop containing nucleoside triphosphate hydrolase protein [Chytridium lagenaria]
MMEALVHVECRLKKSSNARLEITKKHVEELLRSRLLATHTTVSFVGDAFLEENVEAIRVCEAEGTTNTSLYGMPFSVHVYSYFDGEEEPIVDNDADDSDNTISSTLLSLPSLSLEGLWESLIFDEDILSKLLNYVSTSVLFADREVDSNIISFNKVILLHGPPGTGKTSLCKALAQKLSIRLDERYSYVKLVEINSHSLFSKFFSESGKLVMKMFQSIKELCEDQETFVCVLIDEVESLTAARKAAVSGMEPSDAFRVVNALLTQIDTLKRRKNVLILTTSNITEAIDAAFIDRADLKQYIGYPSKNAVYAMLCSTVEELMRRQLIHPSCSLIDWRAIDIFSRDTDTASISHDLYHIAEMCRDFSGRTIRKLPFLTYAIYLQTKTAITAPKFLEALKMVVEGELKIVSN